ncbi:MAG: hypothetical protein HQL31_04665 [Planctomycetes bacterium]|nr:hypothetical protein [Planctomycetota bacterium]
MNPRASNHASMKALSPSLVYWAMLDGRMVTVRSFLEFVNLIWNLATMIRGDSGRARFRASYAAKMSFAFAHLDLLLLPAPKGMELLEVDLIDPVDVGADERIPAGFANRIQRVLPDPRKSIHIPEKVKAELFAVMILELPGW